MNPRIETLPEMKLVGMRVQMNFLTNKTQGLWQRFMPRKKEITSSVGNELYSIEIYPDLSYFDSFNPAKEFEKWAAIKVSDLKTIPEEMEKLIIPAGLYAAFPFKGSDSEAPKMYQNILESWIPQSIYELDHRPHFTLMGDNYKNNDPNSEEEFWFPIKPKSKN